MILIADSGSTKTEWSLIDSEGRAIVGCQTVGLNPYFQNREQIQKIIQEDLYPTLSDYTIDEIFFYGAGCAFSDKNQIIEDAICAYWNVPVSVNSDLLAAAHALCGEKPGIVCILGTGSNSCFYDGSKIKEQISPLGFILGDEGSGAVLGRKLVGDCLKRQLPEKLCKEFMTKYELTPSEILDRVYKKPFPNRYLASFVPFLKEHLDDEAIYQLVRSSFEEFLRRNVMMYTCYYQYPVHFIGSVAFYFQDILKEVLCSLSLQIGMIEKAPMKGLVAYYKDRSK